MNNEPDYLDGLPMGELSDQTIKEYFDDPCNDHLFAGREMADGRCDKCGGCDCDCYKSINIGTHGEYWLINLKSYAIADWLEWNEFGINDDEYPAHWWTEWKDGYCAEWTFNMNLLDMKYRPKFSILKYFDFDEQISSMIKVIEDESICDDLRIKLWYLLPLGSTDRTTPLTDSEWIWLFEGI